MNLLVPNTFSRFLEKISILKNPSQQPSPQTRGTPPAPLSDEKGRFVRQKGGV